MAESIFTRARTNEVFFAIGKFADDTKRKFIHAPFDLVTLDGALYVNTRCCKAANGLVNTVPWVSQNLVDEEWMSARDFFPVELNPVVLGAHEPGNWRERGEDWTGVHQIGFV